MFQQTPQKRVLFPRALAMAMAGGFVVFVLLSTLILLASKPQQAVAATNSTLNFQARLEGAAGNIVADGYYNVEFKLYSVSSGGSALWTETYYDSNGATAGNDNRIQVRNGYVSASLGSQTAFPGTINWDQDLWITMNIGGTTQTATPTWDGEMSPRLKLTGVPYAFKAGQLAQFNASTGFTSTLSLLQPTVGNQTFQIADQGAAGTYTLCVQNSTSCGFAAASGSANYIQNQSSAQQTSSNFWISGNARADTAILSPRVDTAAAGTLAIGNTNATAITLGKTSGTTNVATTVRGTAVFQPNSNATSAFQIQNAAGNSNLFVADTTNNFIGIGTATPEEQLHVKSSAAWNSIKLENTNTGDAYAEFLVENNGGNTAGFGMGGTNATGIYTNRGYFYGSGSTSGLALTVDNPTADIRFYAGGQTAADERFRATANGVTILSKTGNSATAFIVQNAAGSTNALAVDTTGSTAVSAAGAFSAGGAITSSSTITGTTINGTTGINTGAGAGTQRIDASGNLVNINNITAAGAIQQTGSGAVNYITGALGLGTSNPQAVATSALTIANGKWISAVDSAGTGYVNLFQVNSSNQIQVGAALNVDGGIVLPTNGGQMTLVDLGIDSSASSGAKQSYTFRVGSTNAMTVYGEADGSGNAQNVRVAVGSSITPAYTLDVGGDINTSGDVRTGATSRITAAGVLQNVTASAGILTSGTLDTARLSGSYTGITGVGTLTVGTWNATAIGDTYISDTLTVDSSSSVAWAALNTYPTACGAGTAITALNDTPTCSTFATTDTNTTYTNGTDLTLTGTTFALESQLDSVSTISRASSALTLQTTTSGNIILNSAGTIELQDNTNVTGNLSISGDLSALGVVGGKNILPGNYASWEYGTDGNDVSPMSANSTVSTVKISTDTAYDGTRSLEIVTNGSNTDGYVYPAGSGAAANIPVKPSTKYAYSFYAKSAAGTPTANGYIRQSDGTFNQTNSTATNSSTWTRYTATFTTGAAITGVSLRVDVDTLSSTVYFDGFMLEEIPSGQTAASAWSSNGALSGVKVDYQNNMLFDGTLTVQGGSVSVATVQNAGALNLSATGTNQVNFNTNGSLRWSVLSGGQLESNGAQTIRTSTGDLTLATNAGNGNIVLTPHGTGYTNLSAGGFRIGGTEVITSGHALQNVTASTSILTSGTLGVDRGGTGAGTFTANGILYGNGTSAVGVTAAGTTGQCLVATTSAAPTWGSCGAGTTYTAGNDLDLTGTTFDIESQLDSVSVISQASANLTLQTTTSGNIILNSAGTIELQDNTNVTGALTVSSTINSNTFTSTALTFAGAGATTIQAASGQNLAVQSQGAGGLTLQSGSGTVSLGSSTILTASGALTVRSTGATAMAVDAGGAAALNLGTTNANAVTIGNVTNTATTTVIASTTLDLGANATNKTVTIGAGGSTNNSTTVNIANSSANVQTVNVGSISSTSTTLIQGGTSATALRLATGSGGSLLIGSSGVANTIQIGNTTGAVVQTINLGNNATASSTTNVTIGSTIGTSSTLIQAGTGNLQIQSQGGTLGIGNNAVAQTLAIGNTTGATSVTISAGTGGISLSGDVTVAAGKYISLVGGITSTRPASPTAGMLYFDTTTQQLLVYSNSKWQADRSTATKIVADGSTTQNPASADHMVPAAATNAEVTINAAIAALPSGGGTVVLREGTYTVSGAIDLPSNVTLAGAGPATVIKVVNALSSTTFGVIENADQVSGNSYITIRDLKIDGNKSNQSAGTHHGIYMVKAGSGSGTTNNALSGVTISGVWVEYMRTAGMRLNIVNSTVQKSYIHDNGSYGIWMDVAVNNTINGNIIQDNAGNGIQSDGASSFNVISGNLIEANTARGIYLDGSTSYTSVEGNTIIKNSDEGVSLNGVSNNTVSDNKFHDNTASSSKSTILLLGTGSGNTINGNSITDTAGTGYAINVSTSTMSGTYISDNTFSGTGAASINDIGTNTLYAGQVTDNGVLLNRSTGGTNIQTTAGQDIFVAKPVTTTNLLTNPGFDTNTTGWSVTGTGASGARTTTKTNIYSGQGALAATLASSGTTTMQITAAGISGGTQAAGTYTLSFYSMGSGSISGLAVSFGGGGTCALNNTTASVNGYTRHSCTVTTTGATTSISITATTNSQTLYIDAVQLQTGGSASAYSVGTVELNGIIDGPVILQNSVDSENAFHIQTASATTLMKVNSESGMIQFGANTGYIRINTDNNDMTIGGGTSFDNVGAISFSGSARPNKKIRLSPEFPGAVMTADGSNNTGTMTSDNDSASPWRNAYKWTTTQATSQDYDIWVRVPIPSNFDAWPSDATHPTINFDIKASNIGAARYSIQVYDSNGTSMGSSSGQPGSTNTWQTISYTPAGSSPVWTAGEYITLRLTLIAPQNGTTFLGDIWLNYLENY